MLFYILILLILIVASSSGRKMHKIEKNANYPSSWPTLVGTNVDVAMKAIEETHPNVQVLKIKKVIL